MTASDYQLCFLFIVNIKKIRIRPPTTFPLTHRPSNQQLTESLIIFIYHIYIYQTQLGKHITILRYIILKSLIVSIMHVRRSQLYLFSSFKTSMLHSSRDISKFISRHGFFFSVHSVLCIIICRLLTCFCLLGYIQKQQLGKILLKKRNSEK